MAKKLTNFPLSSSEERAGVRWYFSFCAFKTSPSPLLIQGEGKRL